MAGVVGLESVVPPTPGTVDFYKGQRVRLTLERAKIPGESWSLAGVMLKFPLECSVVEGLVTHVRGDRPVSPTTIGVWILQDNGEEIILNARWIKNAEVLPAMPTQAT